MLDIEERREYDRQRHRRLRNEFIKRHGVLETPEERRAAEAAAFAHLKASTARRRPTPDTNPIFWEAPDGWHAAYLVWRVGPCVDYTAATQALGEAMRGTASTITEPKDDPA